jgi:hypothetical protein
MNEQPIASKIQQLNSEPLKQELLFFLDYLLTKQNATPTEALKKIPTMAVPKALLKWQMILMLHWMILRNICREFIARLLIAQAMHENMSLVSRDEYFSQYDIGVIW